MAGGSTKSATEYTNQNSQRGPLEEQSPHFKYLWDKALDATILSNGNKFAGDFLAGPSALERSGVAGLAAAAQGAGAGGQDVRDLAMKSVQGGFLPSLEYQKNPELDAVIAGALRPVGEQLMQTALPGIRSQAISQGAYGGSRQDLSEERAVQNWSRDAGDLASKIAYQDYSADKDRRYGLYGQERARQMAAPALFDAASSIFKAPALAQLEAGQMGRSLDQIPIENEIAKFNASQQAPWYGLGDMAKILTAGNFANTHTVGQGKKTETAVGDPATEIFKGILGVAGLASGMGWQPFGPKAKAA